MTLVSENQHPRSLNFHNQRKVVMLRRDGHSWVKIAGMVVNLAGERPSWKHCSNVYKNFNTKKGRKPYKYHNCGRRLTVTKDLQAWLVRRLKMLRKSSVCTSSMLQRELAHKKGVCVEASTIRRILVANGYLRLPRTRKPKYTGEVKAKRVQFGQAVGAFSDAELREHLSLAMDGVVLSVPPQDAVARENYCRAGETHVWRKRSEGAAPELAGADDYAKQVPLTRAVPLWGGVSQGGFAFVHWHHQKKLTAAEWSGAVRGGALRKAILALQPVSRRGPWHVLCDNESFLRAPESRAAYERNRVVLWELPPKSPDLNPVEKFWGWLRRQLRAKDLADLAARRAPVGKAAFKIRVRNICRTKRAQRVAAAFARNLRRAAADVVRNKGAAVRG